MAATGGAVGFALHIDDELINKLNTADQKIQDLAEHSEKSRDRIVNAFKAMGDNGVGYLITKLTEAQKQLTSLKDGNIDIKVNGLDNVENSISKSADDVNNLITKMGELQAALQKSGMTDKIIPNIGQLKNAIDEINKKLNEPKSSLTTEQQQQLVNTRELFKQVMAMQQKSTEQQEKAAQRVQKAVERETAAYQKRKQLVTDKWYSNTIQKAMDFSAGTKNINEQIKAIQYLKAARDKLNKNTMTEKQYNKAVKSVNDEIARQQKEVDRLRGKQEQLAKSHRNLMDISGQLQRRLALVFSVSQISGYIKQLISVRGEFELQQKSLQVLLQSRDQADKLWQQTVQLAVQSPFRVSELVSFTRQLAAYRIETDKLFDTTKRLADVSAGLGVDMSRLILAYGQVRAANYLRGTELRQFTEAGIPMLEELAKRFSIMEERAVSAGDVFERISKRMVSFKDVEAVFRSMTDAGGTFYKMQEEQSATLKGMISNLHDSIDLMLNDIGKSNEGILKGAVNTAKNVVSDWKEIAFVLEKIVYIMAPAKVAMSAYTLGAKNAGNATLWWNSALKAKIGTTMSDISTLTMQEARLHGVSKAQYAAGKATLYFQGALRGVVLALKSMIVPAAALLVIELYRRMTEASRAAAELDQNLSKLLNEDTSAVQEQSDNYKSLVTQLRNANDASKERRDIIEKLNNQYGQYLDFIVNENTSVKDLANSYDVVIKRMKEKAALATMEKGLTAISESYIKRLTEAEEKFKELFKGASIKSNKDDFGFIIPTDDDINNIMSIIQLKIRELNADQMDSLDEQQKIIQSIVKDYYGEEFFLSRDYAKSIELIDILIDKKKEEEKLESRINAQYKETLRSREANIAFEKLQNKYKQQQIDINKEANLTDFEVRQKLEKAKEQYEIDKIELKLSFGEISENEARLAKERILNWATETVKDVNDKLKLSKEALGFTDEQLSMVMISQSEQAEGMAAIINNTIDEWKNANDVIAEQVSLKSAGLRIDDKILEKYQLQEKLYRARAEALGIELKYVTKINEATLKSINERLPEEYRLSLEDSYKSINDLMSEYTNKENEALTLLQRIRVQSKEKLDIDNEQVNKLEEQISRYREIRKLLGESIPNAISELSKNAINALLPDEYQIGFIDSLKSVSELQSDANQKKEAAIKLEQTYQRQIAQGIPVEEELINKAKEDIKYYTKKWKLLGGIENDNENAAGRTNSLYDERIKVIDDMNKKFKEINKTLGKTEAIQGAFDAYIDAFAKAYEGISWIPKNIKQMTAQEFAAQVLNFPNEDDLVLFLDKLAKEPMKAFEQIKVELAKGKYTYDLKMNAKIVDDKSLKKQVEDLFNKYDLSIELSKLNIPTSLVNKLFGIEVTDLEGLKKRLKKLEPQFKGTDMEEAYKGYIDKVTQMEEQAQLERAKTYVKYLLKSQSEAVKIKIEELRQISEIQSKFEGEQSQAMIDGVRRESRQKLQKQQWKDFQNTNMYSAMFDDIENMSGRAIDLIYDKLNTLKQSLGDLSAEDVKEIMTQIKKLEDIKMARDPFGELKKSMQQIRALRQDGKTVDVLQEQLSISTAAAAAAKENIDAIDLISNARDKDLLKQEMGVEWTEKYNRYLGMTSEELSSSRDLQTSILDKQEKVAQSAREGLDVYSKQAKNLQNVSDKWNEIRNIFTDAASSLMDALVAAGVDADSTAMAFAQMGVDLVDVVMQSVQLGIQLQIVQYQAMLAGKAFNSMLGVIGWIAMALQGITKLFSAIFGMGDKKKQQQIEKLQDQVESLSKTYEKLTEAVDNAYSLNTLKEDTEEANRNLQRQITMYNQMIKLEEDKKKTDKDKIKGWRDEIASLQDEIAENNKKMVSTVTDGILDSVLDASRSFTDAWLEAFQETGKGLSGLESEFKDMMQNLVKQQATMLITNQYVKSWKDALEQYINPQDLELTTDEAKHWVDTVTTSLPQLNQALENYFKAMQAAGVDLRGEQSGDSMSGLQRGIDSLTESTGEILASYLNSIRFFVEEQNTILTNISAKLLGDTTTENPMVTQLKIIAAQTSAINNLLNSCTRGGHRLGGMGLKIFMD